MTAVWRIPRDLRLTDNPTLHAALQAGEVVPVFILGPGFDSASPRRRDFLFVGLHTLDKNLRQSNSYLVTLYGGEQFLQTSGVALTSWRRLERIQV